MPPKKKGAKSQALHGKKTTNVPLPFITSVENSGEGSAVTFPTSAETTDSYLVPAPVPSETSADIVRPSTPPPSDEAPESLPAITDTTPDVNIPTLNDTDSPVSLAADPNVQNPRAATPPHTHIVKEICSIGDLLIVVESASQGFTTAFRVMLSVLRIASPVWNILLDPESRFSEGPLIAATTKEEDRVLYLEEDDAEALNVVFSVLHHNHGAVPVNVTFQQLVKLATVLDKYQCVHAMAPWKEGWLAPWRDKSLSHGYEEWVFIATVFQEAEIYKKVTHMLLLHTTPDPSNRDGFLDRPVRLRARSISYYISKHLIPEVVLGNIESTRTNCVISIPTILQAEIEKLYDRGRAPPGARNNSCSDLRCIGIQLGTLSLFLRCKGHGFNSPNKTSGEIVDDCVSSLEREVVSLDDSGMTGVNSSTDHSECSIVPDLIKQIRALLPEEGMTLPQATTQTNRSSIREWNQGVWEDIHA